MEDLLRIVLIVVGFILGMVGIMSALRIEQIAGYYVCNKCWHKYVPTFQNVFWSLHVGRTRFLKCPHCKKVSWNKKVVSK